ncbi:hypothetical protein L915_03700 [Phytophthora nicotianae]|uniref:Replication protein A OB domain-containing protein n=1 Tax=Phytophthora nicotianae TaxID=4792 RepID=W2HEQ6_PHYNI|nr:hypothetical protein L915_03700 [Phytophthora nicotianae]
MFVRVVYISPARRWANSKGEGHVLSVEFVGDDGERIHACAFNENAEHFAAALSFNGVFRVSRASLRTSKREFSVVPHKFEIILTAQTEITPAEGEGEIEEPPLVLTQIRDLAAEHIGALVNVYGVQTEVSEVQYIQNHKGIVQHKRDVVLADPSNASVQLSIWDEFAGDQFGLILFEPVIAYQCRLSKYRGRTLSTGRSSMIAIDPPIAPAEELRSWFCQTHGNACVPLPLIDCHFTPLSQVQQLQNGASIAVVGVIVQVGIEVGVSRETQTLVKREVTLQDAHGQIKCTLWQEKAKSIGENALRHELAIKHAKVVTYDGTSVGTRIDSSVVLDPTISARYELQNLPALQTTDAVEDDEVEAKDQDIYVAAGSKRAIDTGIVGLEKKRSRTD